MGDNTEAVVGGLGHSFVKRHATDGLQWGEGWKVGCRCNVWILNETGDSIAVSICGVDCSELSGL